MASLARLVGVLSLVIGAALGCGGSDVATAPIPAAGAPNAAPPPPPPTAPSAPAGSSQPATAAARQQPGLAAPASDGDIPAWAGQRPDEPFDVKQFLMSRVAPADNAAPLYVSALRQISGAWGDENPNTLEEEIRDLADIEKLAAGGVRAAQVEKALTAAASAIQQIDAAQSKPECVFLTGLSMEAPLPHAQASRSLSRLAILQLHQARLKGDFDLAEAAVRRSLRMSRDLQPRGGLVCQLVSIANDGVVLGAIERLSLSDPRVTPEQCDRMLSLLVEHQRQGLDRVYEGLRVEYVTERNTIHDLQSGRLTIEQIMDSFAANKANPTRLPRLNYDAEIGACNRLFAMAIAQDPSIQDARPSQFRSEIDKLRADAKSAAPTTRQTGQSEVPVLVLMLVPGMDAMRDANRRATAHLAGLQMLVALRRYELAHGHLPSALEAAAAETILKTVPMDPYAGAPLRYAVVGGKPTIYSIGKDLKDDGGQADWKSGTQPGDFLFVLSPRPDTKLTPPPAAAQSATTPPQATTPAATMRTWTSTAGTTLEAELVSVEGGVATLQKRDGTMLRVPLDKLSNQDQEWIRSAKQGAK